MEFHGPIIRPQTDADSVFIEVTVGCTHNSCSFCNFYKDTPFYVAPIEQVEKNLQEAKVVYPNARKIWASGGNPFALSSDKLISLGHLFKKYFPKAVVSTYARIDDLFRKSVEDIGLVAVMADRVVGAVWARIMKDYGHIDDQTPSLALALVPGVRGHGIGTALMKSMFTELKRRGYDTVSLSVQKSNPAKHLYDRLGFIQIGSVMGETEEVAYERSESFFKGPDLHSCGLPVAPSFIEQG